MLATRARLAGPLANAAESWLTWLGEGTAAADVLRTVGAAEWKVDERRVEVVLAAAIKELLLVGTTLEVTGA